MRSLATGDPLPISERRRMAAQHPPHVVVDCIGGPPAAIFQNGAWNRSLPNVAVFDDIFIDENVYSGLSVDTEHRQRLHELILGVRGVALNDELRRELVRIEEHNAELRVRGAAIPAEARGTIAVDAFCDLAPRDDIDAAIETAERNLAAAGQQDAVREARLFEPLTLPGLDVDALVALLARDLPALDGAAADQLQAHFAHIGDEAEAWVAGGMERFQDRKSTRLNSSH